MPPFTLPPKGSLKRTPSHSPIGSCWVASQHFHRQMNRLPHCSSHCFNLLFIQVERRSKEKCKCRVNLGGCFLPLDSSVRFPLSVSLPGPTEAGSFWAHRPSRPLQWSQVSSDGADQTPSSSLGARCFPAGSLFQGRRERRRTRGQRLRGDSHGGMCSFKDHRNPPV